MTEKGVAGATLKNLINPSNNDDASSGILNYIAILPTLNYIAILPTLYK